MMSRKSAQQKQIQELVAEMQRLREEVQLLRAGRMPESPEIAPGVLTGTDVQDLINTSTDDTTNIVQGSSNSTMWGLNEIRVFIAEFDPQRNHNLSATEWVENIDGLRKNYLWTDQATLFYSTLRLAGPARSWFQSNKFDLFTWDIFKAELIKSFPSSSDDGEILYKIMSRKRKPDECVESYFYEISCLGKRINLPEQSIIKYIISGLQDETLKGVLLASKCLELNELLRQIKRYEDIQQQTCSRNKILGLRDSTNTYTSNNKIDRTSNNTSGGSRKENNRRYFQRNYRFNPYQTNQHGNTLPDNRKCFNCGDPAHLANSCPKKVKVCFNCRKEGHFARECKIKRMLEVGLNVSLGPQGYPVDEYHPLIEVDGVNMVAYIDLGSFCTTIKRSIVDHFKWQVSASDIILKGFGGSRVAVVGKIRKLVKLLGNSFNIELIVVEDSAQDVPVMIGRNFFDRSDIELVKNYGKFEIRVKNKLLQADKIEVQMIKAADITINPEIECKIAGSLLELLNQHRKAVALTLEEIGKTNYIEMEIHLNANQKINQRPYKVAYGLKQTLQENINELLKLGIIQNSTSEYSSPILLVPKKNKEYRMCVDYRKLNSITKKENFPVPNIDETLNTLANKRFFSNLDMMSGYHQIPIAEKSKHLTAFVTPNGHCEYNRMPFGLSNAPAVFMRLMKILVDKINSPDIIVYLDDILVSTSTIEQHFVVLENVLIEMVNAGLTLNLSKCSFLQTAINFLGHEISKDGIKPGITKIVSVEKFKTPQNIKEVRQFLGLSGYFRRFIPKFSDIARPLNELLRKDVKFYWNDRQEQSFSKLKELLIHRPLLTIYDVTAAHEVHTDASSHGLAGILMQLDNSGDIRPVSYFSRATTEAESKYHSYELEALAVVESLERFKHYLLNKHFKVVTDCDSLRLTKEKRNIIPRIARWWLKISEFDFDLEYRSNKKMSHADALSRNPGEPSREPESVGDKVLAVGIDIEDWLSTLQYQDKYLMHIRDCLNGIITPNKIEKQSLNNYKLYKGRLYKVCEKGERFVVPNGIRWRVIKMAHDDMGHAGLDRTIDYIKKYFWFSSMRHTVRKYISSCIDCLYHKRGKDETNYHLHSVERQPIPFYTVHIDHLGPYPKSKSGNMFVIGMICTFTKFIILKAVRNTGTRLVIKLLNEATQYFGIPSRIITDRGSALMANEFKKYCEENSIQHVACAVRTPRGNGQIERYFRTVKPAISAMTKEVNASDWDKNLVAIQWGINSFRHSVTGKSPQELLMGYTPKTILKNKLLLALQEESNEEDDEDDIPLSELRNKICERINNVNKKKVAKFNDKHKLPTKYKKDDLVLIRQEPVLTGQPKKAQARYKGPYVIKEVLENDRYVVTDTATTQMTQKRYESVQVADRMRPWCNLEDLNFDNLTDFEEEEMVVD